MSVCVPARDSSLLQSKDLRDTLTHDSKLCTSGSQCTLSVCQCGLVIGPAETPGLLHSLKYTCRRSSNAKQIDALFHYYHFSVYLMNEKTEELFTKADSFFSQQWMALVWTWDWSSVCFLMEEIRGNMKDEIWGRLQREETSNVPNQDGAVFWSVLLKSCHRERNKKWAGQSKLRFQSSVDSRHKQPTPPLALTD